MMDLTGGLRVLARLKLHASEEFSGDHSVRYNHHHSRDEEQSEQQQHIPEKQPEWKEGAVNNKKTEKEGMWAEPNRSAEQLSAKLVG